MDWNAILRTAGLIAVKITVGVLAAAVIDNIKTGTDSGDLERRLRALL